MSEPQPQTGEAFADLVAQAYVQGSTYLEFRSRRQFCDQAHVACVGLLIHLRPSVRANIYWDASVTRISERGVDKEQEKLLEPFALLDLEYDGLDDQKERVSRKRAVILPIEPFQGVG